MKNVTFRVWLCALFCIALSALLPKQASAQVSLPHYEGFAYTSGTALQTQAGWTSLNGGDDIVITEPNLTYTSFPTSTGNKISFAGAGIDASKEFAGQSSGTTYMSFLLNVTSTAGINSVTGGYFAGFVQGNTSNFGGTIWAKVDGAGYQIGVNTRTNTGLTAFTTGTPLVLGTTYLIVVSYTFNPNTGDDVAKLWLNPTLGLATEPASTLTVTNTSGTDLTSVNRVLIRQSASTDTPAIEMDEVRVGTTWESVTPLQATGSLTASLTSLTSFGNINNGATSAIQTYTLTASGIVANITVTASQNFQVSKDGTNFSTSIVYTVAELANVQTVSVRFAPISGFNGTKVGNVSHSGFSTVNVGLSGNEIGNYYTDAFEYGTNNVDLTGLGGWNEVNAATTKPQYNSIGSLSFHPYPTSQGKASFGIIGSEANKEFDNVGVFTGSAYYSALIRIKSATNIGDYFMSFATSTTGTTLFGQLYAKSTPTGFQLGICKRATTQPFANSATFNTNTTYEFGKVYLVVVKYTFNTNSTTDDVCDLFIYDQSIIVPVAEPSPIISNTFGTDFSATVSNNFKGTVIRQGNTTTELNAPTGEVDYIRFGGTWADVTSVINPTAPTLNVNNVALNDFGSVNNGANSTTQTYILTSANLANDVTVNASTNFQVSKDGTNFSSSISYTATELATPKTVTVRFAPISGINSLKTGIITHTGFTGTTVEVRGTETGNLPTLVANPTSLNNFGSVNNGVASSTQSYTLTANNVTTGFDVFAPANFEISKDGTTFGNNLTYTSTELATVQTVQVRFKPSSGVNGIKSGNITHNGFANTNVAVTGTEIGNPDAPTLNASVSSLTNFGSVNNGANSTVQTYTLTGTNLVNSVTVTAPANFEVSSNGTTFSSTVSFTPAEIANTPTVTVRFKPTSGTNGVKSGDITHSGFANTNVAVSGTEAGNLPTLVANPTALTNFGSVNNGSTSSTQTYTLTATNLTADVTVTAPANFEISKDGTTFANNFTYTSTELATQKTVTVRFKPTSGTNGVKSGDISHSGFANTNVAVSGTEAGNLPTLVANPTSLTNFGSVNNGSTSSTQTYTLTASNLTADVTVTAPANFEISKDGTTFVSNFAYTSTELTTQKTVTVRFKPTSGTNGVKSGDISHSGFANTNVAVSGTEAGNLPTIQTSVASITFSTPVGTNQASATQTYTLSVNNTALFTAGITVTAPTHFEVSKDGTTFSNSLAYTIADMATTQTVRVRFKPTGASDGTRTGNITHTSTGATTKNVGVTGTESLALAVETWANDFNISPNPTRGDLRLRCDAPARWIGATITFTDLAGKEVGKHVWANPSQTLQLNVRDWQKGTYLVRIIAGKQSVVRKIVVL